LGIAVTEFNMLKRVACALVVMTGVACGFSEARQEGEKLAEHYFAAAQRGDTASIFKMYDDDFYKTTAESKWRDMYGRIRSKVGTPRSHTLSRWNVSNMAGTAGAGHAVTLVYDVEYESARGTETIVVFIPAGTNSAGIRGHNFRSDALLQ